MPSRKSPPTPKPLIAYVRVSRVGEREEDRFHSPAEQESRARAHASSKGLAVGEVVQDLDVSGGSHPLERTGMAHALEEIKAGRAGGLVAYSLDRLSRDPNHGDWLVREVTKAGGVILAPDMPEDITSPTGEFTFGMLLGVARLYRKTAGLRFEGAKERSIRAGIPVGASPFGYRQLKDRTLEIDPGTSPIVVELFEKRVAGSGWGELAGWMAEKTGRTWSRRGIDGLIKIPMYHTGYLTYGKFVSDEPVGVIVDAALWHAAQSPKFVRDGRTQKGKWLLSGLLRCGSCGRCLVIWKPAKKATKGTVHRYRCTGMGCPDRVSIGEDVAEDLVLREAFKLSSRLIAQPSDHTHLAPLEAALDDAQRRFDQFQSPAMQDALGDDWPAVLKQRREDRDAALAALGEARSQAGMDITATDRQFQLGHIWEELSPEDQRAALQWVFREIRVFKTPRKAKPDLAFVAREPTPFRVAWFQSLS